MWMGIFLHVCLCIIHMPVWQSGRPEKVYDPIEMESHSQLWAATRGLGIESSSSERATTAFIHWARKFQPLENNQCFYKKSAVPPGALSVQHLFFLVQVNLLNFRPARAHTQSLSQINTILFFKTNYSFNVIKFWIFLKKIYLGMSI